MIVVTGISDQMFFSSCSSLLSQSFRVKGLGRFLIDYVEKLALQKGANEIAVDTSEKAEDLISLYQKKRVSIY